MISFLQRILSDVDVIAAKCSPWGDGFADDTLLDFARVRSWEEVSSDEYIRVFPKLVSTSNPAFIQYLERNLSVLLMETAAGEIPSRSSTAYNAAPLPATLSSLRQFLSAARRGVVPSYEPTFAEHLAFHAALHPVYFWPETLASHQRLTALAWLGIVLRGRSAYLPYDVAEYFASAPYIAEVHHQIPDVSGRWSKLVERRLAGHIVLVRPKHLTRNKSSAAPIRQSRFLFAKSKSLLGSAWQSLLSA